MNLRFPVAAGCAFLAACATQSSAPPVSPQASATPPPPQVAIAKPAQVAIAKPPEKVATKPPAPAGKPQPKVASAAPAPAPPAAKPPAPAPLDLKALEDRLKGTSAIGVLTKLSLKNQVDDLVAEFRAYHKGARPPTLSELRPAFELLLMKVLSLLQDRDPGLAHDVSASRDAIWVVLADPRKLAEF